MENKIPYLVVPPSAQLSLTSSWSSPLHHKPAARWGRPPTTALHRMPANAGASFQQLLLSSGNAEEWEDRSTCPTLTQLSPCVCRARPSPQHHAWGSSKLLTQHRPTAGGTHLETAWHEWTWERCSTKRPQPHSSCESTAWASQKWHLGVELQCCWLLLLVLIIYGWMFLPETLSVYIPYSLKVPFVLIRCCSHTNRTVHCLLLYSTFSNLYLVNNATV